MHTFSAAGVLSPALCRLHLDMNVVFGPSFYLIKKKFNSGPEHCQGSVTGVKQSTYTAAASQTKSSGNFQSEQNKTLIISAFNQLTSSC